MSIFFDEHEVRKAVEQLKPNNQLFEVRIIGQSKPLSAYFTNADKLIEQLGRLHLDNTNVYITLNHIDDGCASRIQFEKFIATKEPTTSDNNITHFDWLFIDMDPVRAAGISSSEEEYQKAMLTAKKIVEYMESLGFNEPVKAVSGNGAHLLYKVDLLKTPENESLLKKCLKVLSILFSNESVKIDEINFNPSRICKLYGTMAQKGRNSLDRPHRLSRMKGEVKEVAVNGIDLLKKLANEIPEEEPKRIVKQSAVQSEFSVTDWMDEHGIKYTQDGTWEGGTKYILDHCPFDSNHGNKDAMILVQSSGAIAFKCFHNSCRDKKWQDVRLMFEPDAYDQNDNDRRIEEGWKQHNKQKNNVPYHEIIDETDEPLFLNPLMINELEEPEEEYIRTGYKEIDMRMKGLVKKGITVVSGLRASAKSTWLSDISLNAIKDGHTVIAYSGELTSKKFMRWMYLQAAGKNKVKKSTQFEDNYYTTKEVNDNIAMWLGDKFWLYNNNYGNSFKQIAEQLRRIIQAKKADLVIIDNVMALNLEELDKDKYEAQTKFVWELKNIANLTNTHIIFVAHPRKAQGFLRLDDISGSGNIANIVDNAFIVHRTNADFIRLSSQMFDWKDTHPAYSGTNVIEVSKNREDGVQDLFFPLWYEKETKRLKNSVDEVIVYPWYDDGFIPVPEEDMGDIPF